MRRPPDPSLTSALTIAAPSFIGSAKASAELVQQISPDASLASFSSDAQAHSTFLGWEPSLTPNTVPTWDNISGDETVTVKTLTTAVHAARELEFQQGDQRTRAFRSALSVPNAKGWLRCTPCEARRTHIPNAAFILWFRFYARIPLHTEGSECPRAQCSAPLDRFGDHLLHCLHGNLRRNRHNRLRDLLAFDLNKAAKQPRTEPVLNTAAQSIPDIIALGEAGGSDLYDIAVVNPLTPCRVQHTVTNPTKFLKESRSVKKRQHAALLEELGAGNRLVPVPYLATGGWDEESDNLFRRIAEAAANRTGRNFASYFRETVSRHAALLVRANYDCLMDEVLLPH